MIRPADPPNPPPADDLSTPTAVGNLLPVQLKNLNGKPGQGSPARRVGAIVRAISKKLAAAEAGQWPPACAHISETGSPRRVRARVCGCFFSSELSLHSPRTRSG